MSDVNLNSVLMNTDTVFNVAFSNLCSLISDAYRLRLQPYLNRFYSNKTSHHIAY